MIFPEGKESKRKGVHRSMKPVRIIVNDKMQKNYIYELTEEPGTHFAPEFKPAFTPFEMLELGVFGGCYMTDCQNEFPAFWFAKAKLSPGHPDPSLNYFHVLASMPLSFWREKGWIRDQDPRGWFQWYCRYYQGRRSPDDARQIKRWIAFKRHDAQWRKYAASPSYAEEQALRKICHPVQRQALLQWAYNTL